MKSSKTKTLSVLLAAIMVCVANASGQSSEILSKQDTLPNVEIRFGWSTIKGHMMEYQTGMAKEITLLIGSSPDRFSDTLCAQVSSSGDFFFRLPVTHITPIILELPADSILPHTARGFCFVGPDEETEVEIDMSELNYRYKNCKAASPTMVYITQGPLAQLANEMNRHTFWRKPDFEEKYYRPIVNSAEEWAPIERIRKMLPSRQVEVLSQELDTIKPDPDWSPALTELAQLNGKLRKVLQMNFYPPKQIEDEEKRQAWERDAVVAQMLSVRKFMNNPKQLFCPDFSNAKELIHINTFLPNFLANERTAQELVKQMAYFYLLDSVEIADHLVNLPSAYQQWVLEWQKIYRKEHDRLATKQIVIDTLQGIPDSLIIPNLQQRHHGQIVFVHFWQCFNAKFVRDVVLPLQNELADRNIVWINILTGTNSKSKSFYDQYANWLRYGTKLKGTHYYFNMPSQNIRLEKICKSMGIDKITLTPYCIISPEGKILRNNNTKPKQLIPSEYHDLYLDLRQCLLQNL